MRRPFVNGGFALETFEKLIFINSPLSPAMLLNYLGADQKTFTFTSGDFAINVDLNTLVTGGGAKVIINSGANITFNSSETLASLTLNGGTAAFTAATVYTVVVDDIAISNNGLLDIANSFLYVNHTAFSTLEQYLANGYDLNGASNPNAPFHAGDYAGHTGITSSVAQASYADDLVVGVGSYDGSRQATVGLDGPNANSGTGIGATQSLIRATRTGDLNGDGLVNSTDVSRFYNTGATGLGWQVGDLNADGVVNSADITIFNSTGNLNNNAAIAPPVTVIPIQATAGVSYTSPVATFTASADYTTPSHYSAAINWGDGTSVDSSSTRDAAHAVTITQNTTTGVFTVKGVHTYAPSVGAPPAATIAVMHNPSTLRTSTSVSVQIAQPPAGITSLTAQSNASGSIVLNWTSGDGSATGFRIESSLDGGVTFQAVGNAGSSATSYTVNGIASDAARPVLRLTPFNSVGDGLASRTDPISANSTADWYRISINDSTDSGTTSGAFVPIGTFLIGNSGSPSASLSLSGSAIGNGDWINGSSQSDAIQQGLSGSLATVGSGSGVYYFGYSNAFQFVNDLQIGMKNIGPAVVFHNPADTSHPNHPDAYVPLNIIREDITVVAGTDQTTAPAGALAIGSFVNPDPVASTTDFAATVRWANQTISTANIALNADTGFYDVSVTPPTGISTSTFTLTVTHNETGVSASDSIGTSATPAGGQPPPAPATPSKFAFTTAGTPSVPSNSITWTEAAPKSTYKYALYRSVNGAAWQIISLVQGTTTKKYSISDSSIGSGSRYYYYVQALNYNTTGQYSYSKNSSTKLTVTTPVDLQVRTTGGSASNQVMNWKWNGPPATFRVYRTNVAKQAIASQTLVNMQTPLATAFAAPLSLSFLDQGAGGVNLANGLWYYTVTASTDGGIVYDLSGQSLVPQIYILGGYSQTEAAGASLGTAFDSATGYQMHFYTWENAQQAQADIVNLPTSIPVVLGGISFGGGEAAGITQRTDFAKQVSLLALFDSVSPFGDPSRNFPNLSNNAFNVGIVSGKDTGTDRQATDPAGYTDTQLPYSTFTLSSSKVINAYDWYQPYRPEYPKDVTYWNYAGAFATGAISMPAGSPSTWHNVTTGTYHTSQFDEKVGPNAASGHALDGFQTFNSVI